MNEFMKLCWPFLAPALAILAVALVGRAFDIQAIKKSHKF